MEHTSEERQKTKEIHQAKFSISSLLLNRWIFSILMSLAALWFLFDITHGFGMAPPYSSEWIVEKEPSLPVDYWALVAGCATLISIWAVRHLCLLQKQLYDWALSGVKQSHLIKYFGEGYWANIFKIFRTNRTTILCLIIFVVVSWVVTALWVIDPPIIGPLGAIGFFEANDFIVAIFFPIFIVLFVLLPYSRLLANLRGALRDFNEEAQTLKSSPITESKAPIIDLVFLSKHKLLNPLDLDRMLGLEPYRDYVHQVFVLASIFLIPNLLLAGFHWAITGYVFFQWLFAALALIHLVAFIYSYVVAASCCNELRESQRQINELVNTLMGASVESGESLPVLTSAQTYVQREVKITFLEWRKVRALAVKIAIPILAALPQYLKWEMEPISRALKILVGE